MLYTSSVAVAIRERVPGHVLGGSMKKKKKKVFDSVCASFAEELAPGEA
jgi:hypothetical protein